MSMERKKREIILRRSMVILMTAIIKDLMSSFTSVHTIRIPSNMIMSVRRITISNVRYWPLVIKRPCSRNGMTIIVERM